MAKASIQIDKGSFERVLKNFSDLERRVIRKRLKEIVKEGGNTFLQEMKSRVPTDTGLLKRNLTQRVNMKKDGIYTLAGAKWLEQAKNPAVYIHILETGGKVKPKGTTPFMKKSFESKQKLVEKTILSRLKGEVEKWPHIKH